MTRTGKTTVRSPGVAAKTVSLPEHSQEGDDGGDGVFDEQSTAGSDVWDPEEAVSQSATKRPRSAGVNGSSNAKRDSNNRKKQKVPSGYKHDEEARRKISEANKGNIPWNLGKNRSDAVRKKIKAGVQAANAKMLEERLQRFGMTKEEYLLLKKNIKNVREKLRKVKAENHKKIEEKDEDEGKREESDESQNQNDEDEYEQDCTTTDEEEGPDTTKEAAVKQPVSRNEETRDYFPREFSFVPFAIDHENSSSDDEHASCTFDFAGACPVGGPGGLICCKACTAMYSTYLSKTFDEIEQQTLSKLSKDASELTDFLSTTTRRLEQTTRAVTQKSPQRKKR